jgi:hypothetical protein
VILKPTVFVLGAGASQAYGFSLGEGLVEEVGGKLQAGQADALALQECGPSVGHIEAFRRDLLNSSRSSIDAFIESRGQDYDEVGRLSIAQRVLRQEQELSLRPPHVDWYRQLLDAILGNSSEQFLRNCLKVITFNFDRSFERKLFLALEANYPQADLLQLVNSIPVLHVHGQLGAPGWLPNPSDGAWTRPYEPAIDAETIGRCAAQLHIVHHQVDDAVLETAKYWIGEAQRVCFLGFSYHELNLQKLGIPNSLRGKDCQGTAFGITPGRLSRAQRLLDGTVGLHTTATIMDYLSTASFLFE